MLSANERNRAKMPGLRRMRLASSRRMRSRTWWSRFSMPQCARTARPKVAASSRTWQASRATSSPRAHSPVRVSLRQVRRVTRAAQAIHGRQSGSRPPSTSKTSTRRCSWRPCRPRSTVSSRSEGARPAQSATKASRRRGWLSLTRTRSALPVAVAQANVFLAVQGIGGEQHAAQAQLLDQRLRRRDLVALGDLLVGQDERRLAGEGAEHLGGGPVVQVVEAAPQRLAVERDDPPPRRGSVAELLGVAAEGGLQLAWVERVQEGAQRVDGGGAAEAGAEGGVERLAVHADEQADAAVGGGAGQHRQDAEQQQVGEAVAPALAAARVGDLLQGGEQAGERHHGGLRCEGSALNSSGALLVPRPQPPPSGIACAQNRTALPLDACLTSAYDARISSEDANAILDDCDARGLLQQSLDCGYAISDELYKISTNVTTQSKAASEISSTCPE